MNGEQSQNSILSGPDSYTIMAKDIKSVQVQESDLVRLKSHLCEIKDFSIKIDLFNLLLGAAISGVITVIVQWVSTKSAPVLYLILTMVCLALSFVSYVRQEKRMDMAQARHLLNEAKRDLNTIFVKANVDDNT